MKFQARVLVLALGFFLGSEILNSGLALSDSALPYPSLGSLARFSVERTKASTGEFEEHGVMTQEIVAADIANLRYTVRTTYVNDKGQSQTREDSRTGEDLKNFNDMGVIVKYCHLYGGKAENLVLAVLGKFSTCKSDFEDAQMKSSTWYSVVSFGVVQTDTVMKNFDQRFVMKLIESK